MFEPRQSPCPTGASGTSGSEKPKSLPPARSLSEFYPPEIKRRHVEGTVQLRLKVDSKGCTIAGAVEGSSGVAELDRAALEFVEVVGFVPAEKDGKPTDSETPLRIRFEIKELPTPTW